MLKFKDYLTEAKDSSSKSKAMSKLVDALKSVFEQFDLQTRHFVWEHLNSPRGKELVGKLLRNPKTYLSDSEFTKLIEKK